MMLSDSPKAEESKSSVCTKSVHFFEFLSSRAFANSSNALARRAGPSLQRSVSACPILGIEYRGCNLLLRPSPAARGDSISQVSRYLFEVRRLTFQ